MDCKGYTPTSFREFVKDIELTDVTGKSTNDLYEMYLNKPTNSYRIEKNSFVRKINELYGTIVVRKMIDGRSFKMFVVNDDALTKSDGFDDFINIISKDDVIGHKVNELYDRYLNEVEHEYVMRKNTFVSRLNDVYGTVSVIRMVKGVSFKIFVPK